jgi:hypothetical protein
MCAGPGGDERHLLCAAHGLSVEYAAGDKAVLVFLGGPALQEGTEAGVFEALWRKGLLVCDGLRGTDWSWLARDKRPGQGAAGRGRKTGPSPADRGKRRVKRSVLTDGRGVPPGAVIEG